MLSFAVAWGGEVDVMAIDFLTISFPALAGQSGDHAAMCWRATVATQHLGHHLQRAACHGWRAARRPPFSARRPALLLRPGQARRFQHIDAMSSTPLTLRLLWCVAGGGFACRFKLNPPTNEAA
jgi:hypothetical protein